MTEKAISHLENYNEFCPPFAYLKNFSTFAAQLKKT